MREPGIPTSSVRLTLGNIFKGRLLLGLEFKSGLRDTCVAQGFIYIIELESQSESGTVSSHKS